MTFCRCTRCNATFSYYKRDEHQCEHREEDEQ